MAGGSVKTDPLDYRAAVQALRNREFCTTQKFQEQQWRANRVGAHSEIMAFEKRLIKRAREMHIPLFAHNMVRTKEEQDKLFLEKVSKAVGGNSPHNHGCAVDIVHSRFLWNITKEQWKFLGHLGKEVATLMQIRITWGGDWKFYDPAHWELSNWRERAKEVKK